MRLILILTTLLAFQSAAESEFDYVKALADKSDADAQLIVGYLYDLGEGVPENDAEAVKWYRKAAQQGYSDAQQNLGFMYAKGEGVQKNYSLAYVWWSMAKWRGNASAAKNIDLLKPKLIRKQIEDGQALAAKCFESNYKDCD